MASRRVVVWIVIFGGALVLAELPPRVDHTTSPYFPPIGRQSQESCALDAGISTLMTFEWNRLHGTSAADPRNQLAGHFLWHFLNRGENRGAELSEGWHLAAAMGAPSAASYQGWRGREVRLGAWPHGYPLYYEAMRYRVRNSVYRPLKTPEQVERAKRWLFGRGSEKTPSAALLAFEARLQGSRMVRLPEGAYDAGKSLVLAFGAAGKGHAMVYAGYDDRVGYDVNGDGHISNDVDVDGDGAVTLKDWERGAFILANSYGRDWGDSGKSYVLYRESAVNGFERGKWVGAIDLWPSYQPMMTLRLTLWASCQTAVRLRVLADDGDPFVPALFDGDWPGTKERPVSREPSDPERHSRFLSGKRRLSLAPARQDARGRTLPVELGFDLTGHVAMDAARYTIEVQLASEGASEGEVEATLLEAHLRRYQHDGRLLEEKAFAGLPLEVVEDAPRRTLLRVR